MLTLEKLNPKKAETSEDINKNLGSLLEKLLKVEAAYGKPLSITSGLRDLKDHKRVYAEKNTKLKAEGKPELKVPMGSKHLYGQAADIADADGAFWKWAMVNIQLFIELGLYFEDKTATPTWVHLQLVPPGSGKRIFKP